MWEILGFTVGLGLMLWSSEKALDILVRIARALGISKFLLGATIASIGTNLPEIFNSLFSHFLGHADLNVGDSLGSPLAQATLVLGLALFFHQGSVRISWGDVGKIALSLILAFGLSAFAIHDGYLSRADAGLLILGWILCMFLFDHKKAQLGKLAGISARDVLMLLALFALLGVGAYLTVKGSVRIAELLGMREVVFAFLMLGLSTSLPELVLEITAMRKGHSKLAIGDSFGSSVVDATLSLGIGALALPMAVSPEVGLAFISAVGALIMLISLKTLGKNAWPIGILTYIIGVSIATSLLI